MIMEMEKDNKLLSDDLRDRITAELEKRKALGPCPRCGHSSFVLADGLFAQILQKDLDSLLLGGRTVPTAVVVCTNCGFVSQYALGILGLLEKAKADKQNEC